MKKILLAFVCALSACTSSSNSGAPVPPVDQNVLDAQSCNVGGVDGAEYVNGSVNGIVNGKKLGLGNSFSSRIALVYTKEGNQAEICTGSLLPGNVILTAGHCVGRASDMYIFFTNNLACITSDNYKALGHLVTKVVSHPGYTGDIASHDYDLAMLHFKDPIPMGYLTFDFPTASTRVSTSENVVMAGFGTTGFLNVNTAGVLRITKISGSKLTYYNDGRNIEIDQATTGVCQGDSGSGLLVSRQGRLEIVGVASNVSQLSNQPQDSFCSGRSSFVDLSQHQSWLTRSYDSLRDDQVKPNPGPLGF